MWMKNPETGSYEWIMYIVALRWDVTTRKYFYTVKNEEEIHYGSDVEEGNLRKA